MWFPASAFGVAPYLLDAFHGFPLVLAFSLTIALLTGPFLFLIGVELRLGSLPSVSIGEDDDDDVDQ